MKTYVVGGAVRDRLLGLPVQDRDHVVVGATPEQMLQAGFRPVGRDFPVFLHPTTQEEYALARTERKTARGYHGFAFHTAPDVTLEQDLARRDLTINAMAVDDADGRLIDPYGGRRDLQARVLRHVSPAFAEDPVRILRLARFAARFVDFDIAAETAQLMRAMVEHGEVDHLVPERVWQEFARGLGEAAPWRMFAVLADCGALARLLPEWQPACEPWLRAAAAVTPLARPRWAALALPDAAHARLRAPAAERALARLVGLLREPVGALDADEGLQTQHEAAARLAVLERADALRQPQRWAELLLALGCAADAPPSRRWQRALDAARGVDAGAIARRHGGQVDALRAALHAARLAAVAAALQAG